MDLKQQTQQPHQIDCMNNSQSGSNWCRTRTVEWSTAAAATSDGVHERVRESADGNETCRATTAEWSTDVGVNEAMGAFA